MLTLIPNLALIPTLPHPDSDLHLCPVTLTLNTMTPSYFDSYLDPYLDPDYHADLDPDCEADMMLTLTMAVLNCDYHPDSDFKSDSQSHPNALIYLFHDPYPQYDIGFDVTLTLYLTSLHLKHYTVPDDQPDPVHYSETDQHPDFDLYATLTLNLTLILCDPDSNMTLILIIP